MLYHRELFGKGETSEPNASTRPGLKLKYGSQKKKKGVRNGQKTAKRGQFDREKINLH